MAATLLIGPTVTESGQNITTEHLLFTHVASGEELCAVQISFSSLNAAAASIRVRLEHTLGNDTVLAYQRDVCTVTKWAAANTIAGMRLLGPVLLLDGEKLNVYGFSDNASDTSATYAAKVIDCAYATKSNLTSVNGTAGIKVDLLDAPNVTAIAAFVSGVWGAAVRTVTNTIPSTGDIATAVWAAATRTLSAFGFTPSIDPAYDAAKTAASASNLAAVATNVTKIKAAVYDSATVEGDEITLSNGTTQTVTETGCVTVEP